MIEQIVEMLKKYLPSYTDEYYKEVAQAIADIDPWTRVKDGLPEGDEYLWVTWLDDDGKRNYGEGYYHSYPNSKRPWGLTRSSHRIAVTHWLKITPPKG